MKLDEWMKRARHDSVTLGDKTNLSPQLIQFILLGKRRPGPKAAPRLFWASRGQWRPADAGLDDSKFNLPDLSILPDPDDVDVSWNNDCAPILLRLALAEGAGANP